ncbi:hypothetical protein [Enterococcus pallens]|uniref:hypothetical protein n=1 Tax=Enterococcus pallens TaxID=160454 RepID=UPI001114C946|nr:hypothetical protein [Enterococcus pallens]
MNEALTLLAALLGGGTVGTLAVAYLNHKGKTEENKLTKDEKAFSVLEGRIRHLEKEMDSLKAELKVKDELVDRLKEENLLLKYENKELKEELEEMKGEQTNGASN